MRKTSYLVILCFICICCKTTSSETKDALYEDKDGMYYYAWKGEDNKFCVSQCIRKPNSIEEALVEGVCTQKIKYVSAHPVPEESLLLNIDMIIDVNLNISLLYHDTKEHSIEEVNKICLTDKVLERIKRDKDAHIEITDRADKKSDFEVKQVLTQCYSTPPRDNENTIFEVSDDEYEYYSSHRIKDNNLACFNSGRNKKYAIVKEVKLGLSYDEAEKYCTTPGANKYVKDWNEVKLGVVEDGLNVYPFTANKPIWVHIYWKSNIFAMQGYDFIPGASKESTEVYTVCIAHQSNLKEVYMYDVYVR